MINELIEQIGGRERLEALASFRPSGSNTVNSASRDEWMAMARALLEVLDAKPVGEFYEFEPGDWYQRSPGDKGVKKWTPLYKVQPAARVPDVNFDLSKPGTEATVITHYQVPDGWKLVPLKAFPSQWAAGQKAFDAAGINKIDPVYHAMVEAAPAPGDKK